MENPNEFRIVRILRRVRNIIGESIRFYESTGNIDNNSLCTARHNLRRISNEISIMTYHTLLEAIDALLLVNNSEEQQHRTYIAPRISNG